MDHVLVVCTGNICRSPMAERLLTARIGSTVRVESAGLLASGVSSPAEAVDAMREFGVDISTHLSRRVDQEMLARADLVIGMAREHVREVTVISKTVWPKVFTLKELVRRGKEFGARSGSETLTDWLVRISLDREHTALLGDSQEDDVEDPIGGTFEQFTKTVDQISALVDELVELAWSED
ncbi:MAG: arsenate reductase/protein-tyrosine-phosphatase family protein [Acidimicrobiales bacterium]|nr:hypothetical protein [Actinomycetota bacterium]